MGDDTNFTDFHGFSWVARRQPAFVRLRRGRRGGVCLIRKCVRTSVNAGDIERLIRKAIRKFTHEIRKVVMGTGMSSFAAEAMEDRLECGNVGMLT
jgi:hypothetical protein